ncbi:hypothetical protein WJX74_006023 [Apatococcus lobatus]|uniref:Ubiquitin-related modifier 1 homolog n=1 Tax=Apatococcus lobatus TaxID=904363 RepID=A0AAW1RXI2_9CHLO
MVAVTIELSGGLEALFGEQKTLKANVPSSGQLTASQLIKWTRDNLVVERADLFVQGNSVRPGILVLINDTDWELCGLLNAEIEDGDTVVFISTLHGG